MKVYLVRHTSVDIPKGVCYGQTNVALKETFQAEATVVGKNLKEMRFDAAFSSPLTRCRRLASFCGYGDATVDNRLKELHFGDWEMQRWDAIDMAIWQTDWINSPAPNGESVMQMYERITSFFDELRRECYKSVVIFTHGGVISCSRIYFKQVDDMKDAFKQIAPYGEIVEFTLL